MFRRKQSKRAGEFNAIDSGALVGVWIALLFIMMFLGMTGRNIERIADSLEAQSALYGKQVTVEKTR